MRLIAALAPVNGVTQALARVAHGVHSGANARAYWTITQNVTNIRTWGTSSTHFNHGRRRSSLERCGNRRPNHNNMAAAQDCMRPYQSRGSTKDKPAQPPESNRTKVSGTVRRPRTSHALGSRGRAAATQYPT